MTRTIQPKVVTGNALISGKVVWLTPNDGWTDQLAHAAIFHDPDTAKAALARAQAPASPVVGCYLADVTLTPQGPAPTHFREAFRVSGPSAAARIPG
jgi:hypothetical protein